MPHDAGLPEPTSNLPPVRHEPNPVAGRIEAPPPRMPALVIPGPDPDLPPGLSAAPDAGALLRSLGRRWVAAVCLGGTLAAIAGIAAWFAMSPDHTAFARVQIAYQDLPVLGNPAMGGSFITYLRTQAGQIMSRRVLWPALKSDEVKRLNLDAQAADPVSYVEERLRVDFQENSELVTVLFSHPDPAVATTLLKAIMKAYKEEIVDLEERSRAAKVSTLLKTYDEQVEKRQADIGNLNKLEKQSGTADPVERMRRLFDIQSAIREVRGSRNSLGRDIIGTQADLDTHDARVQQLKDRKIKPPALKPAIEADPDCKELRRQIERRVAVLDDYVERGLSIESPTPQLFHREVARLRARLARREKAVEEELRGRMEGGSGAGEDLLAIQRIHLVNKMSALKKLYDDTQRDIDQLLMEKEKASQVNLEIDTMRDKIERQGKVVNDLGIKLETEKINLNAAQRIQVFQEPELQKREIKKQLLVTAAAPLAVLFSVCMALAWMEHRKRRVRTASEVARGLGIPVVAAVPDVPDLGRHLVGPDGETGLEGHPVLESIDALRTVLLRGPASEAPRVVMVTSATSGEGKTTLAAHLAGSLARAGRRTLLIDGDLRNPAAHQLFELPQQPGFSEALLNEVELTEAVKPTPLEGLSFLAAGQWDREVIQALARGGLEGLFDKLRQEFDFLVIDSHPVLAATDSLLLGQQVDAVILSVLREVSQMPRVWTAAQRLAGLGIRVLGAVVNGTDPEEALPGLAATARTAVA
jgi:capsular exopolysaccharide synthesis family protein